MKLLKTSPYVRPSVEKGNQICHLCPFFPRKSDWTLHSRILHLSCFLSLVILQEGDGRPRESVKPPANRRMGSKIHEASSFWNPRGALVSIHVSIYQVAGVSTSSGRCATNSSKPRPNKILLDVFSSPAMLREASSWNKITFVAKTVHLIDQFESDSDFQGFVER